MDEQRRLSAFVPNQVGVAPGQRVRIETWAPHLEAQGWEIALYPFEDERLHDVLYQPGHAAAKAARLAACYQRQLKNALRPSPDVILVYREAALVGPALIERLARRRRVPLVYDLDDPTWIPYRSPTSGWSSLLKFPGKTRSLLRLCDHAITINDIIGGYARRYAPAVTVVPNCVDTDRWRPNPGAPEHPMRLVWTGSHTTAANLRVLGPSIARLQAENKVTLRLVGAGPVSLPEVQFEERPWTPANEVRDIADCHVGLVPLVEAPWNRWKFFLKVVQYMAAGLAVVAQRTGSNPEVVEDGKNGFLVDGPEEWFTKLTLLADDPELRRKMGANARTTAIRRFSTDAQMPKMTALFDRIVPR